MKNKTLRITALAVLAAVLFAAGFFTAKIVLAPGQKAYKEIVQLHKDVLQSLPIGDDGVTVIGHMSPDTDTVCSAIAWARLLNSFGFKAEAAVTGTLNRETAYLLKEAGTATPPVLGSAAGRDIFLVDHSEYAQAIEGMEDANIVGIIDHHGVGSVTTTVLMKHVVEAAEKQLGIKN